MRTNLPVLRCLTVFCTICLLALLALATQPALADTIPLGTASAYTVLYDGTGGHNLSISNVTINGNVGVGGTGVVQYSGPGDITGRVDFNALQQTPSQFHNTNGMNKGPSSVNFNVGAVGTAVTTITSLSTDAGALTGNSIAISGTETINESAGKLQMLNGHTYRVFTITSYSENDGKLVTINGDGSGDIVLLNFGSALGNVNLGGDVSLTGGLTDDQLLWNFNSLGKNINLNNNQSSFPKLFFHGGILAPQDCLSLVNANLDGRVLGGNSCDMQIVSGDHINAPVGAPEPPTMSLLAVALFALAISAVRRGIRVG